MTCEFIHKTNGNRNLIVIFAGWSTGSSFYSHVIIPGWDTLVVSGYSDLDFNAEILDGYKNVALFAWSLGVYAASRSFPFSRACFSIAINGTEHPVNDTLGIPGKIFTGTAATLNERNLTKFRRRMAGDSFAGIADSLTSIPISILLSELDFIRAHYLNNHNSNPSFWNRVYVSSNDLIFPPSAQMAAWKSHESNPQIIELDAPHYVDLLPIIKGAVPQHDIIGKRFSKALPTYDSSASPQRMIAESLVDFLTDHADETDGTYSFDKVLEIGPGTGFLSRSFAHKFHPRSVVFVDLFDTVRFQVAPDENYIIADAESWIEEAARTVDTRYDAVISASAIQWFVNPSRFFHNAAQILKTGGVLLCSTFLPDNLSELRAVNPYGLVYHSSDEIKRMLSASFPKVFIKEGAITATFSSPRETLSHLIHTGVGGSAKSSRPLGDLLQNLPTSLTYRPLYILAIK